MRTTLVSTFMMLVPSVAVLASAQTHAEYVGGTTEMLASGTGGSLDLSDAKYFAFYSKDRQVRVSYDQINLVEYGQKVDRRLALAVVISPMFLLSKSRKHFLTLGYTDDMGHQQALVFRVDKTAIRPVLSSLEARTGLKVQYQDLEARKAGKG
ncbi:MAG: hypothetical protein ABL967_02840 [Bryobacteraceae bacterium]